MSNDKIEETPETAEGNGVEDNERIPVDAQVKSENKDFFELLYGVLSKPSETLRYIAQDKPVLQAILLFVAMSWVTAIAGIPGTYYQFRSMPDTTGQFALFERIIIIGSLVATPFLAILGLVIVTAIYNGIAKLFKGEGTYGGMISSYSFATFPRLLATPFALVVLVGGKFGSPTIFFMLTGLYTLISLAFGIWSIFLEVIAIRETHNISTGKAVLSYLIPGAVLFAVLITLIISVIIFFGIVAGSSGFGAGNTN